MKDIRLHGMGDNPIFVAVKGLATCENLNLINSAISSGKGDVSAL